MDSTPQNQSEKESGLIGTEGVHRLALVSGFNNGVQQALGYVFSSLHWCQRSYPTSSGVYFNTTFL